MVRFLRYIIILFSLSFLFSVKSVNIITTNDIHGFIDEQRANFINPNYPPLIIGASGYYEYVKNINDPTLILDGGNFFQGHPVGIIDSGRTMIDWMNKVGYDALVPGNNDFLFGVNNLIELSKAANFNFLAANLYDKNFDKLLFKPYEIFVFGESKIAVLGLVNPNLEELVLSENIKEVFLEEPIVTLNKWIPVLESLDVNSIILLTSAGVPWDREEVYNDFIQTNKKNISNAIELGYHATGVDIIVSGGISKGYSSPWYDPHSHVYTFQNYGNGTSFGHFILNLNEQSNMFEGFNYAVTNNVSQTLFLHDFSYNDEAYNWIKTKSLNAINSVYKTTDWSNLGKHSNHTNILKEQNIREDNWDIPIYDTDENLDIITWNCEFFPTAGDSTISALSEAVMDLNSDIIAFQEIKNRGWFSKLMDRLPEYNFIISEQSSFMDQAIIYKKNQFILVNKLELFAENDYNFAGRPPLKVDFIHKNSDKNFSIINLHMKCCDSGLKRRKKASKMLYDYLDQELSHNSNIIVLGDWNDDLKDREGEHCFSPFMNDNRFIFPTLDITYDISQASYPKEPYVSFLDHILVTKKILSDKNYKVQTIPIDSYMGGFDVYEKYISDHMPVYLSFPY